MRCGWGDGPDPAYRAYHDLEWGVPVRDERRLFELLVLEGAQAGLSWATILNKRDGYRRAFTGFEPSVVAGFDESDVARLLADPGIVRNRAKVVAAIGNGTRARAGRGSRPRDARTAGIGLEPGRAPVVVRGRPGRRQCLVRAVRNPGRDPGLAGRFVGPTICYALMQSAGLANGLYAHDPWCFRSPLHIPGKSKSQWLNSIHDPGMHSDPGTTS